MIDLRKRRSAVWLSALLLGGLLLTGLAAMAAGDSVVGLPGVSLIRFTFGSLVAIGVMLLGARWLLRVYGALGLAATALSVVASLPVGQRERVVVVQVGERQLMLGVAPGRVALLHTLDENLKPVRGSDSAAGGPSGAAWLARVLGKSA
jgi:flagellar protein FliO/FliZ